MVTWMELRRCIDLSWASWIRYFFGFERSIPFRRGGTSAAPAMPGDTNYIHEQEIWKQRLKNETEGAAHWYDNWGFLAGREPPEPRGFSTKVAKYSYGGGQWSVKSVRVPDNTAEGLAAATSEQNARTFLSSLTYETNVPNEMKPCKDKVSPLLTTKWALLTSPPPPPVLRSFTA